MQYAAVIGRQFPVRVLQKVTGLNGAVSWCLSQLESAEFVVEVNPPPLWEYGFQQALIQEVAYEMLLLQRRRQYHEHVARAMEEIYADRLDERAEALAYHYARSDNRAKAIAYLIQAGEESLRLFTTADAQSFFAEALANINQLPPPQREQWVEDEMRCCEALGDVATLTGDYASADEYLRRSLHIREELGDVVGIASALNNLGNLATDRGHYHEAEEFYHRSYQMRAKMGHKEGMSAALVNRGNVAFNLGKYADAEQHYEEALDIAERVGNTHTATFARHFNAPIALK